MQGEFHFGETLGEQSTVVQGEVGCAALGNPVAKQPPVGVGGWVKSSTVQCGRSMGIPLQRLLQRSCCKKGILLRTAAC